ncbi:MAG: GTP 3',8-cyclase MoaA, partial [Candidatus Heimdallarchaeota archaeon]|nr:GTP 3',8-cyclase MoaA [Candidatus Heimdallarchaeota archaeon]
MAGIDAANLAGFHKIKINAVSIRDFNTDAESLKQFIDLSETKGVEIRFIELMPFTGVGWEADGFIKSAELIEIMKQTEEMVPLALDNTSQTSRIWSLRDKKARFGFISSVSESFCSSCDRIRITAEGNLRPCLHNSREYPLRELMRSDSSDEKLLETIQFGLSEKWKEHP